MSRRRAKDPTVGIRITIPKSVLTAIEDKLAYTDSRSAWITKACHQRLAGGGSSLDDFSTQRLLSAVRWRDDISEEMKGIIEYWLTSFFS